jgi:hypothetical protein
LLFDDGGALFRVELEDVFDGDFEHFGDAKGEGERGGVAAGFEGDDSLARDGDFFGERFLGHLAVLGAQVADVVG